MDHATVRTLQIQCFGAIVYGGIPFAVLGIFFRVRWANRVANLLGFVVLFYVTVGQTLWSLPYYGTHWDFGGALLLADGVTCIDGCRADAVTLAIRNYGSPMLVLMVGMAVFLAVITVLLGSVMWENQLKHSGQDQWYDPSDGHSM